MQPDPQPDDTRAADELLHPSYWLVYGLPWEGDGVMAEAALAIAPGMIARESLSRDAFQILGCADLYAAKRGQSVVFFSDLTRMFTTAGTSWAAARHRLGKRTPRASGRPIPGAALNDLRSVPTSSSATPRPGSSSPGRTASRNPPTPSANSYARPSPASSPPTGRPTCSS